MAREHESLYERVLSRSTRRPHDRVVAMNGKGSRQGGDRI
jgi:hypothetical protein